MRRFPALFSAALLLVAACGDDGGDGAETYESPTEDLGEVDEGIDGVHAFRLTYPFPPHRAGDIEYALSPPAGGLHDGDAYVCGFYDAPVVDEIVVHDLEHGAVWLSYAPDLDEDDVEVIHDLVRENEDVVAAPHESLDEGVAVVATAWARQLTLDAVDDPRLEEFIAQYVNGPQTPEQGVGCTAGRGEPIP